MNVLLQDWVTRQAELRPEATAVALGAERLTYGHLEKTSNQLAQALQRAGAQKADRVCFLMPKSPVAIVSMIGILKAGCIHVPLDAGSPALRIRKIVESCDTRWLLAAGPVVPLVREILDDQCFRNRLCIGWLERGKAASSELRVEWTADDLALMETEPVARQALPMDAAHIPVHVRVNGDSQGSGDHAFECDSFCQKVGRRTRSRNAESPIRGHTPLHFDLSTFDVFGTFAAGAELHLVPHVATLSPVKIAEFIRTIELTQWFSVPSVLNYMAKFDVVKSGDFPALRRVLWCGEVLPTRQCCRIGCGASRMSISQICMARRKPPSPAAFTMSLRTQKMNERHCRLGPLVKGKNCFCSTTTCNLPRRG